jgi:hypothetical protein
MRKATVLIAAAGRLISTGLAAARPPGTTIVPARPRLQVVNNGAVGDVWRALRRVPAEGNDRRA